MRPLLLRLYRDQRLRFLAVGATNTVVGYGVFALLERGVFHTVPFGYMISLVLSYACAITLAFVLYRTFVFKVRGSVVKDFLRFVTVYLTAIGINLVLLPLFVQVLHLDPLAAQAIVLVLTTLLSFVGHKHFSFRRRPPAATAPDTPPQPDAP